MICLHHEFMFEARQQGRRPARGHLPLMLKLYSLRESGMLVLATEP